MVYYLKTQEDTTSTYTVDLDQELEDMIKGYLRQDQNQEKQRIVSAVMRQPGKSKMVCDDNANTVLNANGGKKMKLNPNQQLDTQPMQTVQSRYTGSFCVEQEDGSFNDNCN